MTSLERNELEKSMLGRGIKYEIIQLIMSDFTKRINDSMLYCEVERIPDIKSE
jgi:hypothetical protein